jgi:catechol 2,3-dioxygenase-like lactoylglutathione lyase family enzyme
LIAGPGTRANRSVDQGEALEDDGSEGAAELVHAGRSLVRAPDRRRCRRRYAAAMRVSSIMLRVADMERSLRFYRDAVGLAVVAQSPQFSFLDAGTVQIVLGAWSEPLEVDRSLTEIVLEVDDIDTEHAAMSDRGVEFRVEPRPVMHQDDRALHAADFRDPDGHLLSITGWVDAR